MPSPSDTQPAKPLGTLKKQWNVLLAATTSVMATIHTFWELNSLDLSKAVSGFATFTVSIVLGLMVLPQMKYREKSDARLWWKVAAVALVLGTAAFFSYLYLRSSWTVKHQDTVLYVGSEPIDEGVAKFLRENRGLSKEELLEQYASWDPALIWTERSIIRRRLIVAGLYVLCTPIFAIAMIAVIQLMYCATRKE